MSRLRVIVIEDDPIHASKAEMLLEAIGYQLVGIASNSKDAIPLFLATKPDVVLMDIDLNEQKDGIDLARRLLNINPVPIIFVTAFTDKATFERAKTTEPYAYMIKPLAQGDLERNIELAVFNFAKNYMKKELEGGVFTGWSQNLIINDSFFIKTSNHLEKVRYEDVLWVQVVSDRYCEIKTASHAFSIRESLKNLTQKFSNHQFIRIHRTYMVNAKHIDSISEQDALIHIGEQALPIGTSYKKAILEQLNVL